MEPTLARSPLPATLAFVLATCAGIAGLSALGALPASLGVLGATTVFCGAGLPWLVRWSPVESSPLKLLVFGACLSPVLCSAALFGLDRFLEPESAVAALLLGSAVSQLLWLGRPLGKGWPGSAGAFAWVACAAVGVLGWYLLVRSGSALRLGHDSNGWHASVAQHWMTGAPLEDPWLPGESLRGHPGFAYALATVARLCGTGAEMAQAWFATWAVALLPAALYLLAAVGSKRGWAHALALGFAAIGWNALGGLWPMEEPGGGWGPHLASATPLGETGEVLYAFSTWMRLGPASVALTYAVAAWSAGAHGLRNGRRPWVGLTGILAGATLILSPPIGCATVLALAVSAGLRPGSTRAGLTTMAALAFWAVPGVLLWLQFGPEDVPRVLAPKLGTGTLLAALPLLVFALWSFLPRREVLDAAGSDQGESLDVARALDDRTTVHVLTVVAAVSAFGLAYAWPALSFEAAVLARLASLPLAILAAEGLARLGTRVPPLRFATPFVAGIVLFGGGRASVHAWSEHVRYAYPPSPSPVEPVSGRSGFTSPSARSKIWEWLAKSEWPSHATIVVARPGVPGERIGFRHGRHVAPLVTGCALWIDEPLQGEVPEGVARERMDRLGQWLGVPTSGERTMAPILLTLGRPVVVLVDERDRSATAPEEPRGAPRGIDRMILAQGGQILFEVDGAALYLLQAAP
tara:strand:- start:4532 stop:6610 length:2079 start_codon:yes stop_codon:yes gene_type:complete